MPRLARLLPICLAFLVSACSSKPPAQPPAQPPAPPDDWIIFESEDGGFSIAMPEHPKEVKVNKPTPIGELLVTIYMVFKSGSEFMVNFNDYPDSVLEQGPDSVLERAQQAVIAKVDGNLIASKKVKLGSHPGLEFDFEDKEDGRIARQRVFLVNKRLYVLRVMAEGSTLPKETDAFLLSFKLK